jgi:zinc/manganese transport system substrate-binding protein
MTLRTLSTLALLGAMLLPAAAHAKMRVAASITDLASIAASVGGDEVDVFSIAKATADPHHVEVLPSYMVKVSRAKLYLKVGLGLDQWADGIIDGSRNDKLMIVDCSKDIDVLEKPTTKVTALQGDVHPNGNPHYWLDPRNGAIVARTIADALAAADPSHAADYQARAETFAKEAEVTWTRGSATAQAMPVKKIVTYHRSWVYFGNAFGIEIAGEAEPVPGIPPTAKHLAEVVSIIKSQSVPVFVQEPYFSDDAGKFLARETGIRVIVESPSCDSADAGSYLAHINGLIGAIGGGRS